MPQKNTVTVDVSGGLVGRTPPSSVPAELLDALGITQEQYDDANRIESVQIEGVGLADPVVAQRTYEMVADGRLDEGDQRELVLERLLGLIDLKSRLEAAQVALAGKEFDLSARAAEVQGQIDALVGSIPDSP